MKKPALVILLILFSHATWSETFELVCDVELGSLTQARYRFDSDSQMVTGLGFYSGSSFSQIEPLEYKTIGWDLDPGMLVWVANEHGLSEIQSSNPMDRTFDILVFDMHNMVVTLSRSARRNGLIEHTLDFTEPCIRDEVE